MKRAIVGRGSLELEHVVGGQVGGDARERGVEVTPGIEEDPAGLSGYRAPGVVERRLHRRIRRWIDDVDRDVGEAGGAGDRPQGGGAHARRLRGSEPLGDHDQGFRRLAAVPERDRQRLEAGADDLSALPLRGRRRRGHVLRLERPARFIEAPAAVELRDRRAQRFEARDRDDVLLGIERLHHQDGIIRSQVAVDEGANRGADPGGGGPRGHVVFVEEEGHPAGGGAAEHHRRDLLRSAGLGDLDVGQFQVRDRLAAGVGDEERDRDERAGWLGQGGR